MTFNLLIPNSSWWLRIKHQGIRGDLTAGITGALLAFPQAIALAALAGMPPVYGLYASIIPVILAALWGSSWFAVSGPNTAMSMLTISAVAPMAAVGSSEYIAIVLLLMLMTGMIQLAIGLLRLGRLLDFISTTVIAALSMAVALSMMVVVLPDAVGSQGEVTGPVFRRLLSIPDQFADIETATLGIFLFTLFIGILLKRLVPRFSILVAMLAGTLAYLLANSIWPSKMASVELLDKVEFELFQLSWPNLSLISFDESTIIQLITSAFSLAMLGLTQAIVIARSLGVQEGQRIDTDREIVGQGLSNVSATFVSGMFSSSSFNRSASNLMSGAITPVAAILSGLLLALIALFGSAFLTLVPVAVIAGGLMLIALAMFKPRDLKTFRKPNREFVIFIGTLLTALGLGLIAGVIIGVILSTMVYLWVTANPRIRVEEQTTGDGKPLHIVTIEGSLFFGAVQQVEQQLRRWTNREGVPSILLIRTDHISYLDVPGVRLLAEESQRRRKSGGEFYLYVVRDAIFEQLRQSRLLPQIGEERVIRPYSKHPMKPLLSPELNHRQSTSDRFFSNITAPTELADNDSVREAVIRRLRTRRLFSRLSEEQLGALAQRLTLQPAQEDEVIISTDTPLASFLILIDGNLLMQGQSPNGELHYSLRLQPTDGQGIIAPTTRHELQTGIRALTRSHYLMLDQQILDEFFGWPPGTPDIPSVSLLDLLDKETLQQVHSRMRNEHVKQGHRLVSQGESANQFYLLLSGTAEVSRLSSVDGQSRHLANLGEGDSFGEEGLLQQTTRNATVRMTSDGEIGILDKADFDSLIRPVLAPEIDRRTAQEQVDSGYAQWLDVRFEPEFNSGAMPDAKLIPLDQIRSQAHELDPDLVYIVYCNNGHRSLAATFLLRERNIDAFHLTGGINDFRSLPSD